MRRASVAVLFCAIAFTTATPHAAGRRFITETDLFKFTWIADPQISPDGSTVAFVRVTVNEKENRYESSLYAVPTAASQSSGVSNDTPRRLTSNIRDTSPRWAPDGKRIAFVRAIEKDGKVQPAQIYLLAMDGGEARPLSELANGAGSPVWSPDGKMLAFSSQTGREGREGQEGRDRSQGDPPASPALPACPAASLRVPVPGLRRARSSVADRRSCIPSPSLDA